MSYVYPAARSLVGQPKVGNQECVALVRHYTHAPIRQFGNKVRAC